MNQLVHYSVTNQGKIKKNVVKNIKKASAIKQEKPPKELVFTLDCLLNVFGKVMAFFGLGGTGGRFVLLIAGACKFSGIIFFA